MLRTHVKTEPQPHWPPIGAHVVTATILAPSGEVIYHKRRYEATSRGGLIEADTPATVVAHGDFCLIVEPN